MSQISIVAPNLEALYTKVAYPLELADFLWKKDAGVAAGFRKVTETSVLTKSAGVVTWFGFRTKNKRLPEFYAIEVTAPRELSLYDLGATGNCFDVDIVLTDKAGKIVAGLFEYDSAGVRQPANVANGVYQAKPAHYSKATGLELTKVTVDSTDVVILWVVSYRHAKYGSRLFRNGVFEIPIKMPLIAAGKVQDDDGSPPDPMPGGGDDDEGGDDGDGSPPDGEPGGDDGGGGQ